MIRPSPWIMGFILAVVCQGITVAADGPGVSPEQAVARLRQGNERFTADRCVHPDMGRKRLTETATLGQHPFATIVTCSDSRVAPELIFDEGIGDLFVIRVAGNVCGTDEIASIEYGVEHLGTPVLVILGHTHCGAVEATTAGGEPHGNIPALLEKIQPALAEVKHAHPQLQGEKLNEAVVEANIWHTVDGLFRQSPLTRHLVESGKLKVLAAKYDIATGSVQWLKRGR